MLKRSALTISIILSSFGSASAADLFSDKSVATDKSSWGWTGAYVGLSVGYGWGDSEHVYDRDDGAHDYPVSNDPDGYLVGFTLGYNYLLSNNILIGIEGDIGFMDVDADDKKDLWDGHIWKSQFGGTWGTLRGRLGYAWNRALIYGTAGLAFMETDQIVLGDADATQNTYDDGVHTGWVVGGGLEYQFTDRITGKVEYLYMNFDEYDGYTNNAEHYSFDNTLELVRIGVNYRF